MHVHVFTPGFSACKYQYICIVYDKPIDWFSFNCSHASIRAHTPHHVHKSLYTLICLFYDKLVVHMCIYTFSIACMYSVHSCSCIHSMFSVHTITDICASSTTTERLLFHGIFPWIVYMQVFMRILIIMCTYYCTLYYRCRTHLHEYFHHCLHVFTACILMYSIHVFSPCKYQYICIVYDIRSTEVPLIVPMQAFVRILLIMCTNHCTL